MVKINEFHVGKNDVNLRGIEPSSVQKKKKKKKIDFYRV